jgi:ATP-dependent DNA ligase
MQLPVQPPLRPMLAKAVREIPDGDLVYEPKWDGFRCIVFRDGDEVVIGSRNEKPLTRYFPELLEPIRAQLPERCVVDGELVVPAAGGLDFDLLGQRIHPAASRVERLAAETPAHLVVFDLLALGDVDLRPLPLRERRAALEQVLGDATPPVHLTPVTADPDLARDWFERFDGSGFDGVMAKPVEGPYVEDKRVQFKVKHHRTADCVVAGYRLHKDGGVGSLLLGLFDEGEGDAGGPARPPTLHHVGVCSAFATSQRRTLLAELSPYETDGALDHPWRAWGDPLAHGGDTAATGVRMPGAPSRWSGGRNLDWVPLRCELVVEVTYENLTGMRFRHPARFVRWRPDKATSECRYSQLEHPPPVEYTQIFVAPPA